MTNPKKIVCLGGGNAMPKAVLSELKKESVSISVICAMLDSGGSAGRLRRDYKINAPGDIRRALLALANTSPVIESLFNFRFQTGDLKGHNFANLFIAALELSSNSFEKTLAEIKKILNIKHKVFPATLEKSDLHALLENGKLIKGETNIDIPKHNGHLKIKKVFLHPRAKGYPPALKAIQSADLIIIGPGDLYSSLAQVLLVEGMAESIRKSKAPKLYICNLMNKYGETNDYQVEDFAKKIEEFIGCSLDWVIYNNQPISAQRYKGKYNELTGPVLISSNQDQKKFIGAALCTASGEIIHHSKKLIKLILKICFKPSL